MCTHRTRSAAGCAVLGSMHSVYLLASCSCELGTYGVSPETHSPAGLRGADGIALTLCAVACRGCFLAHSFCNYMGLPNLGFCSGNGQLGFLRPRRQEILLIYAVGIVAFATSLFPMTEPSLYGGSWLWNLALKNTENVQKGASAT
jgi:hypothetical protein